MVATSSNDIFKYNFLNNMFIKISLKFVHKGLVQGWLN